MFTGTRAVFIGLLGVLSVLLGTAFMGFQKGAWIVLGALYATIGVLYVFGGARFLNASFGPGLARLSGVKGSVGLGLLFGFNVPACAAPLIFALLGTVAASGVVGAPLGAGFLPLVDRKI